MDSHPITFPSMNHDEDPPYLPGVDQSGLESQPMTPEVSALCDLLKGGASDSALEAVGKFAHTEMLRFFDRVAPSQPLDVSLPPTFLYVGDRVVTMVFATDQDGWFSDPNQALIEGLDVMRVGSEGRLLGVGLITETWASTMNPADFGFDDLEEMQKAHPDFVHDAISTIVTMMVDGEVRSITMTTPFKRTEGKVNWHDSTMVQTSDTVDDGFSEISSTLHKTLIDYTQEHG